MSKLREEAVQSVSAVAAVAAAQMASAAVSGAPMRIDQLRSLQAELSGIVAKSGESSLITLALILALALDPEPNLNLGESVSATAAELGVVQRRQLRRQRRGAADASMRTRPIAPLTFHAKHAAALEVQPTPGG